MSFEGPPTGLDYYPCRYGKSRLPFRGPRAALDGRYTVVLGGSETYGKYVEDPFCDQLAERTGRRVANLGIMNGSVEAFVLDRPLLRVIRAAQVVVVQAMGAQNLSNRYYTVHPRRNDRFLRHSRQMERLFPEVDFSDFVFTRHMLGALHDVSPERFATLRRELQATWSARMRRLLSEIPGQKVMLWIEGVPAHGPWSEPLFVTLEMMQGLEGQIDKFVHVDVSDLQGDPTLGRMVFPETERPAARLMMTPDGHARVAAALAKAIRRANGMAA
ncbi:DUF6473 family protein [Jannaschia ovalis]|uniref:DUF6473 family protein n=1 Tax=Jannaschia ovalis TaxID=3038773 RepID=A0ABY8LCZ5_9RHOB|nr:DUF6473 family protein [Jannaschia sp. GRR-S6-38]WGH79195.1 DUF6473 family protein [Jannaschia sp. GRR-S6-38]